MLVALAASFLSTYIVKRDVLLQDTLEANRVYAEKLAHVTENYLRSCRRLLFSTADELQGKTLEPAEMQRLAEQLIRLSDLFNSILIVNPDGVVVADSSHSVGLVGTRLIHPNAKLAMQAKGALTSQPFRSPYTGRWLVTLSQPIVDEHGNTSGYIAGTIYLHVPSILRTILGEHAYAGGSYTYVIDSSGMLIYHPTVKREGEVIHNAAEQAVRRGERGAMRFRNQEGVDMLGGYAPVPSVGWGIIVQKSAASVIARVDDTVKQVLLYSLPAVLFAALGIWWLSNFITLPLRQLAAMASRMEDPDVTARLRSVRGWYQEAADLRRGLLLGVSAIGRRLGRLRRESLSDPLTGLLNRRGLDLALSEFDVHHLSLAFITFDIDKFKTINDRYGHHVGDLTVKQVSRLVEAKARSGDVVARLGGDEFMVVLPKVSLAGTVMFAERLRELIERSAIPGGSPVTLSVGVARYPQDGATYELVMQAADKALYDAKTSGRNRVHVYGEKGIRNAGQVLQAEHDSVQV